MLQVTAKSTERPKLVWELLKQRRLCGDEVYLLARIESRQIRQISCMGIKIHKVLTRCKGRDICQVIAAVKAYTESACLAGLRALDRVTNMAD